MSQRLKYRKEAIIAELKFETSRSGGKGGQHVNKTETKVCVVFDITSSAQLSQSEKNRIGTYLKTRLANGVLRINSEESRSQHRNKEMAIERMFELLEKALFIPKKRRPTTISKGKKEARLKSKKQHSEKKNLRKKI